MQSSSNLFPVALLSAERRGDLSEDVYRIKAGNSPDASVELAVTRLGLADHGRAEGVPVILLHGSFSNRRFWYSPKGIGLGAELARAGFAAITGGDVAPYSPYAVHLPGGAPGDLPAVADGRAHVQDDGSQLVAAALAAAR
ncbi:MAG: alpha/beta hydrolase, partial [Pseudomonas sp.]